MTDYLNDFVQESEESITELNNALLDLERNPDDDEAMDQVFRTAHTLKGNAGAMGFEDASDLAHAMEDLLDAIRAGSLEVSPELMDEVFDAVDALEAMIDEVDEFGETRTDPDERIDALRDRIEESTGLTKPSDRQLETTLSDGRRPRRQHEVFHARLSVSDAEGDEKTGGGVVLDALTDAFDFLSSDPDESVIRDGDYGDTIDVAFGSVVDEAAIAAALKPVDTVEDAIITEVPDDVIESALEPEETDAGEAAATAEADVDPDDMSVDELLDEFQEYDDLDEAVQEVDDVEGLENMGEAGAFSDIVEEDVTTAAEEKSVGGADDDGGSADAGSADAGADADAASADADEREEVEDVEATFNDLQDQYDRVGLDEMEDELEGVSFGEYDEEDEVGFDELLGEEFEEVEPTPAEAEAEADAAVEADAETGPPEADAAADAEEPAPSAPAITDPDEESIEAAVEAAETPSDPDRGVFVVRLSIVEESGVDNGTRVIEALRDAFDLLGTVPGEDEIGEGDYGAKFDAVFGSDVGEEQIESALDPVDEVDDAIIVEVTDRMPEVEPEPAEPTDAEPATGAAGADDEPDVDEVVPEEPDDAQAAFSTLQNEYDQVGLDQMERELEGVSFGEYDEEDEVGFDELLGEDLEAEEEPEREEPTAPTIEAPDDDAIESAVDSAAAPSDPDRGVFLVRLSIVEEADVNNGIRVIEALRDAFDVLGTVPTETAIGEGDYDATFDAVFGSDVGEEQIESALDPVDEVADAIVVEVTDRMPEVEPEPAASGAAEAGTEAEPADAEATEPADAETAAAGGEPDVDEVVPEEPDDAQAAFATLQDEYDQVGIDQMERELEGVSFGEYDEEDEVGFGELLGEEFEEETAEPAAAADEEFAGAADADDEFAEAGSGEEFADADDDFAEADAGADEFGSADAGADDFGGAEESFAEAGTDEFGDDEFGGAEEDFAEAGTDEFGEVETGTADFGDVDEAEADLGGEEFDEADVEVDEISIDEEAQFDEVDVDEVEAGEADEFGDVDAGADDEFGTVETGTADFGDVEEMQPGEDVGDTVPDQAEADVDTVRGIGEGYADQLADADVETVGDLVVADPGELAGETGISAGRIEEWIDRAPVNPSAMPEVEEEETEEEEPEAPEQVPGTEREMDEIQSVRVDVDRIDELMNLVEEMVTSRARLRRAVEEGAPRDVLEDELDEFDVVTSQMQDQVMEMRLVPVQTVTQRLPRVVRDISRDQGKRVRFETEGEDVEVDRSILNEIGDPLIHLVRNAVDHGIEDPDAREAAGKDPEGTVTLRARRSRDTVIIEVEDDGSGLDADELRDQAVEEGVISRQEADQLSDSDAYDLIFRSGFSTRDEVTDVSGRGVGMDVVANTVDELDGQVTIESDPGEGTTVRMTLPVTVAISEVLFLEIGGEEYGVPIKVVDEIGAMGMYETVRANGHEVLRDEEGEEMELIRLNEALDTPDPRRTRTGGMLVTIEDEVRNVAIQCDEVHGQQEVVVKPFEGLLADIPGLSGAAVLGEGDVINVLDVETL